MIRAVPKTGGPAGGRLGPIRPVPLTNRANGSYRQRVFASGCQDVYGTMYLNLVYCGPYTYEGEAISSMQSIAEGACWGHAYYYWHVRVGDFGGDAYYDSMWTCG